eukprot:TRINITY_DN10403_c0_g1_i6.p1 TRINITY_DN10403_c0_g1~~TRINITY_DN10403_c0_g1_i6.p1  ORF type:complete len:366 (-),score=67.23 TRINITY_DN10403_c0_g1_i6:109-1206(-)
MPDKQTAKIWNRKVVWSAISYGHVHIIPVLQRTKFPHQLHEIQGISSSTLAHVLKRHDTQTLAYLFTLPEISAQFFLNGKVFVDAAAQPSLPCLNYLLEHVPHAWPIEPAFMAALNNQHLDIARRLLEFLPLHYLPRPRLIFTVNLELNEFFSTLIERALPHVPLPTLEAWIQQLVSSVAVGLFSTHPLMWQALEARFGTTLIQWMNYLPTKTPTSLASSASSHWVMMIRSDKKIPLWERARSGLVVQDWAAHKLAMFYREIHWQVWKSCACADPTADSQFVWPLIMDLLMDASWIEFQDELKLKRAVEEFKREQDEERQAKWVTEINELMERVVEKMCKKAGGRICLNKSVVFADVVKILLGQE